MGASSPGLPTAFGAGPDAVGAPRFLWLILIVNLSCSGYIKLATKPPWTTPLLLRTHATYTHTAREKLSRISQHQQPPQQCSTEAILILITFPITLACFQMRKWCTVEEILRLATISVELLKDLFSFFLVEVSFLSSKAYIWVNTLKSLLYSITVPALYQKLWFILSEPWELMHKSRPAPALMPMSCEDLPPKLTHPNILDLPKIGYNFEPVLSVKTFSPYI